jgi:hypothetical protein
VKNRRRRGAVHKARCPFDARGGGPRASGAKVPMMLGGDKGESLTHEVGWRGGCWAIVVGLHGPDPKGIVPLCIYSKKIQN